MSHTHKTGSFSLRGFPLDRMESRAPFLVAVLWWLCFLPGFYSGDSFGALHEAASGTITTAYAAVWPLYLRVATFGGRFPALATLLNVLLFTYALQVWCRAALPQATADRTLLLMTATPLVGAMGITLWHDIPMTSGFLLLAGVATSTQWFSRRFNRAEYGHLLCGSALGAFRPNGPPTLLLFLAVAVVLGRNRRSTVLYGLIAAFTTLAVSVIASALTGNTSLISAHLAQEWMRADISCMLSKDVALLEPGDHERLARIGGAAQWASPSGCTWLNRPSIDADQFKQALDVVPGIWLNTARAHPQRIAGIHAERHAYLIPLPRRRAGNTPFIHSTIEFPGRGISWVNPRLSETLRIYVRAWNAARGLFAFAGLWLVVLMGLAIAGERISISLGPTLVLAASLVALLFVTAPIPDARYALFVLVTGQSALLSAGVVLASKLLGR